jgi:hypothetical protein
MSQTGSGKTKIVFDSADVANSDNIGANLIANGTQLTATGTALDVNVTASALPTGAATETTLASILSLFQALDFAEDSAHTSGDMGIQALLVRQDTLAASTSADGDYGSFKSNNLGELYVKDTGANTALSAIQAVLEGLDYADGSAWAAGSMGIEALAVRKDASGPLTGVADGDFSPLQLNANGELKVAASITIGDNYAEDSAHSSGAVGSFSLGVRNDNQATSFTSADGDYSGFAVDIKGAQYVKDVAASSNLQQIVTVGTSAVQLPATSLSNRSSMMIQMLSSGTLYLGSATVTNSGSTRGFRIGDGGFVSLDVGPANLVYGVANAAGKDVMVWEFA